MHCVDKTTGKYMGEFFGPVTELPRIIRDAVVVPSAPADKSWLWNFEKGAYEPQKVNQ